MITTMSERQREGRDTEFVCGIAAWLVTLGKCVLYPDTIEHGPGRRERASDAGE